MLQSVFLNGWRFLMPTLVSLAPYCGVRGGLGWVFRILRCEIEVFIIENFGLVGIFEILGI